MPNTVLLVDAHHHIYRAFYAISPFPSPTGEPVNAIYGFTRMLRKWLTTYRPTHVAAVFDGGLAARRTTAWPDYKANRPTKPGDLESQIPLICEILKAMGVYQVKLPGEEADDVIATLAHEASRSDCSVYIISNDKDFAQLVSPKIYWVRAEKKESVVMDEIAVANRYGVKPESIIDFMCLVGDKVDNIPGVPGVGQKTAAELLNHFGNLDQLLTNKDKIQRPKLRAAIQSHTDQIRKNRVLVELRIDLQLPSYHEILKLGTPDNQKLAALFDRYGFKSLLADLDRESQETPDLF